MIHLTYELGRLSITSAGGARIGFRPCDLQYEDRMALIQAVSDIAPAQPAGNVGFLRTQPLEERERGLEELFGIPMSELFGDEGRSL